MNPGSFCHYPRWGIVNRKLILFLFLRRFFWASFPRKIQSRSKNRNRNQIHLLVEYSSWLHLDLGWGVNSYSGQYVLGSKVGSYSNSPPAKMATSHQHCPPCCMQPAVCRNPVCNNRSRFVLDVNASRFVDFQKVCYSARTELLYVKSRYIGPLIPISFSYLKPFLLDSYLGWFCPDEAPDQCFFGSFCCATQQNIWNLSLCTDFSSLIGC